MKFRTKDLEKFFLKKPNWNKIIEELNSKSFETVKGQRYLEADILPNRFADAGSLRGLAREISAITGLKIKEEKWKIKEEKRELKNILKVKINTKKCLNYFGRVILDVKNDKSPKWLKEFLNFYNINSYNLIVDLSNYVMIKYGAPLHVFDLDKIEGKEIIVRESKEKEIFHSLKDKYYLLNKGAILITDKKKIIALAGIQGAKAVEVDQQTKNIFIEAGIFDPSTIYKTSRELNLQTEASYRFERGVLERNALDALNYLTYLIQKLAQGKVAKGIYQYQELEKPPKILLKFEKLYQYYGQEINKKIIKNILLRLGCRLLKLTNNYVYLEAPPSRLDLQEDIDLIEEIIRLVGYDKIEEKFPLIHKLPKENEKFTFINFVRNILSASGADEILTYNFINQEDFNFFQDLIKNNAYELIEIINPISSHFQFYRPFIFINHLKAINKNLSFLNWLRTNEFILFEIGEVGKYLNKNILENTNLAIFLTGSDSKELLLKGKGLLNYLLKEIGVPKIHFKSYKGFQEEFSIFSYLHTEKETSLGFFGLIKKEILSSYKIEQPVVIIELNLDNLLKYYSEERFYQPIPKFPAVIRDLSIVVPEYLQSDLIENEIYEEAKGLLEEIELFDIYQGPGLRDDQKSLSYHLIFRSEKTTLKEEEVNGLMEKIQKRLKEKFNVIFR